MPILLIPVAAAGYMYYKKRMGIEGGQTEQENGETKDASLKEKKDGSSSFIAETELSREKVSTGMSSAASTISTSSEEEEFLSSLSSSEEEDDSPPKVDSKVQNEDEESLSSSGHQQPQPKPSAGAATSMPTFNGPVARFRTFCRNLEKEFDKARERKAREENERRMKQMALKASTSSASSSPPVPMLNEDCIENPNAELTASSSPISPDTITTTTAPDTSPPVPVLNEDYNENPNGFGTTLSPQILPDTTTTTTTATGSISNLMITE